MTRPSPDSFEGQILALLPALRRYSRSLVRSDGESDDLLQDCVEKVLTRKAQWRGANLRSWALTIMTNLYRNGRRAGPRRQTVALDLALDIPSEEPAVDPLMRSRLEHALDGLAADYRAVLMLVVIEGCSYSEVATMLDIPIGTVMSRLSRARQRIAETMASDNVLPLRRPK